MENSKFDGFFSEQSTNFSDNWKAELKSRWATYTRKDISVLHSDMFQEMIDKGKRWLIARFPNYKVADIEDISQNACERWYTYFDATKAIITRNPELNFFFICCATAQATWHNAENPKTKDKFITLDKDGNPILDENGNQVFANLTAIFLSFPDFTNHDDGKDEELEKKKNEKAHGEITGEFLAHGHVDNENATEQIGLFEFAGKRFSHVVGEEIMKYYLLSGRVKANGRRNTFPKIRKAQIPPKKSISYQTRPEFCNLSNESRSALSRLQCLKNAGYKE